MFEQRYFVYAYFFLMDRFKEAKYWVDRYHPTDLKCLYEINEIARMLLDIGYRLDLYDSNN